MTHIRKEQLQRVAIICVALLALIFFPFGFSLVVGSGEQLVFGFDDFPIMTMLWSFGLGILLAIVAAVIVFGEIRRRVPRRPPVFTIAVAIFGILSVPAARWMTKLEQDRKDTTSTHLTSL